jgi:hypothetical protein
MKKFAIQHDIEVNAVPFARVAVFMISTGYAQESGPMPGESNGISCFLR